MKKTILKGKLVWIIPIITTVISIYYIQEANDRELELAIEKCATLKKVAKSE